MQKSVTQISSYDELEYPYEVKFTEISKEMNIAYLDEGTGPALIMIHGLGSYAPAWKKTIEGLKTNYRCIAIDLPSYGKSSKGNYEGTMTAYADVINSVMENLNIEKATILGHSMGGQIAMIFSLAYPEKIDKMVLVSPAGFETFTPGQREWFDDVVTARGTQLATVETIVLNVGYNFYKFPDDAQFMIDDRIAMRTADGFKEYTHQIVKSVNGMLNEPVYDLLPKIETQTLVIYGKNDNLIPNRFLNPGTTLKIATQGTEQLPNAELKMIDKAGHFVHFEKAEIVSPIILEFLKK